MANVKDALEKLQQGILLAIEKSIKNAPYDKTVRGRITESLGNNKYKVLINGASHTVKSKTIYNINDTVYVLIPQNNENDMLIIY